MEINETYAEVTAAPLYSSSRKLMLDRAPDPAQDSHRLHSDSPALIWGRLSRKPKKRGPFHLVPVMAKATWDRLSKDLPF